jgi:hypothetical protein
MLSNLKTKAKHQLSKRGKEVTKEKVNKMAERAYNKKLLRQQGK